VRFIWVILGIITISGVAIIGLYENSPETISITVSEPTERTITSTTFQAESQSSKVISNSYQGVSETNSISNHDESISLIQKADAITATEERLDVIRYELNGGESSAIDNS